MKKIIIFCFIFIFTTYDFDVFSQKRFSINSKAFRSKNVLVVKRSKNRNRNLRKRSRNIQSKRVKKRRNRLNRKNKRNRNKKVRRRKKSKSRSKGSKVTRGKKRTKNKASRRRKGKKSKASRRRKKGTKSKSRSKGSKLTRGKKRTKSKDSRRGKKGRNSRRHKRAFSRALAAGFVTGVSYPVFGYRNYFVRYPFDHVFWGPRSFYGDLGLWYYSSLHSWYYPTHRAWFYPWNHCWYYPGDFSWYYPNFNVTVYEAPKKERVVYVTNESKSESYFAVYYREKFDGGYYLYGVGFPKIIKSGEKLKASLPSFGSSNDYIVIVDDKKDTFKKSMIQDGSGKLHKKDFATGNMDKKLSKEKVVITDEISENEKKYLEGKASLLKKNKDGLDRVAKDALKQNVKDKVEDNSEAKDSRSFKFND